MMDNIYTSHPMDSFTLIKQAIADHQTKKGKDPEHLVVPKWMLSSLKEMKLSASYMDCPVCGKPHEPTEPLTITAICGISVSSLENTLIVGGNE